MFDAHCDAKFKTRNIEATMATMGAAPHVTHVLVRTGGNGPTQCAASTRPGSSAIGRKTWRGDRPGCPHRRRKPRGRRGHPHLHP
jgi:hypothetical protein